MKPTYAVLLFLVTAVLTFVLLSFSDTAVEKYEPVAEEPHPEIDSLFDEMDTAIRSRRYRDGRRLALTALDRSQRDAYRSGEVYALTGLGFIYQHEAKYDSSISFLEEARRLVQKHRLDPHLYHRAGIFLAGSYQLAGLIDEAIECLNDAKEFFKQAEDYWRLSGVYNELGILYKDTGFYTEAEEVYLRGLEIAQYIDTDESGRRYYHRSFTGNLGILYTILGKFDKAVPRLETSLRIGREMNDPVAQAIDLSMLGEINFSRGNFRKALNQYLESAALAERAGQSYEIIRAYINIARVYDVMNDFNNAFAFYRKAVAFVEDRLDGRYEYYPEAYIHFALHNIRREKLDTAEPLLEKAFTGYRTLNTPREIANSYLVEAELEFLRDNFALSLEHARTAAQIYDTIGASDADLAGAYLWMGLAFHETGVRDSALAYYQMTEELSRQIEDRDASWRVHYRLARLFNEEEDTERAAHHLEQSIASIERLRYFSISPELAGSFLTDKTTVYKYYFDVLFNDRRTQRPDQDKLFALSEQTRGRVLLDILGAGMQNIFSQIRESAELQETEERIVAVNRFIRDELAKPVNERRNELINEWQEQLTILQREYDTGRTEFAAAHPELSTMFLHEPLTIADIQTYLPLNTLLISYFMSDEYLYSFIISSGNADIIKLSVINEQLRYAVERLRIPFEDVKEGRIDLLRLEFDIDLSRELYAELIEPLAEYIDDKERLIIVPDGPLYYLPFELLIADDTGRYLLEDFVISYLPTCALIPLLHERRERETGTLQSLMAFGDPLARPEESEDKLIALSTEPQLRNILMTPLPAASREVEEIALFFDPDEVLILTGDVATESAFKRYASNYRYIHFATHGYVNELNPNYSALLLNPGEEGEDGLLHAYEIFPLTLNAELVSMSACETGLGRYMEGEGLISLVQAFFAAGSRNVMASLWSVEESTYPIMVEFYKNINNGMNIADALREAKLTFISTDSAFGTHPFLWAPFVLYGLP